MCWFSGFNGVFWDFLCFFLAFFGFSMFFWLSSRMLPSWDLLDLPVLLRLLALWV